MGCTGQSGGLGQPVVNVGLITPGGLLRIWSTLCPSTTQSRYTPTPPRMLHLPVFEGSHAKPTRGLQKFDMALANTPETGRTTALASRSFWVAPLPNIRLLNWNPLLPLAV